ncbi:hypothetical protein ACGF5M_01010 [Gemmatimonadota bacterium]
MNNRNRAACVLLLAFLAISLGPSRGAQAQEVIRPDLAGIATGEGWTLVNRGAALERDGERTVVSFDGRPGAGAAWLDGVEFSDGTIEVMIRGRNNPGGSFVGVAFRGVDNETYDAVYFRPFNFVADNDLSRSHMVQYISHPESPWHRLREVHTGIYENRLPNPPHPDRFFRARIVISKPEVRVFVGDDPEPCLVVRELTDRNGGRIGLWMGNTSDGSFADLVIRPAEGPLEPVQGIG